MKRLSIEEAERRYPDMVRGQKWKGNRSVYQFTCEVHGTYNQRYDAHDQGLRCGLCFTAQRERDRSGERIGHWTILARTWVSEGGRQRRSLYTRQCDCGHIQKVRASRLGHSTQCWRCANKTELGHTCRLGSGRAVRNEVLAAYKKKAALRGYIWDLRDEEFDALTQQNCFYCGAPPTNGTERWKSRVERWLYNGIDRRDNAVGYTTQNAVPCCRRCNEWKRSLSAAEFQAHAKKIVENLEKQNG
jgi:hypothetical protein